MFVVVYIRLSTCKKRVFQKELAFTIFNGKYKMPHTLVNNQEKKRYEFQLSGMTAFIEYLRAKNKIYLTHTEVPKDLEGQGIGGELVRQALEDVKSKDFTLVPLCPFVALYIKRHPEWKSLVLKGINIA